MEIQYSHLETDDIGEAVPSLLADRADCGRVDVLVCLEVFEQLASANRAGIVLRRVSNAPVSDDVVHNDDPVLPHEALGLKEVSKVSRLVGVNEGKVKGRLGLQLRDRLGSGTDDDLHSGRQAGVGDVSLRNLSVLGLKLQSNQFPVFGQGASQPDGGEASESADFEDTLRADRTGQ